MGTQIERRASGAARFGGPPAAPGFTLIEAALAILIVGVGVLAIVQAEQAYQQQNIYSQKMGTALMLANELREVTLHMPKRDPQAGAQNWGPEPDEQGVAQYNDLDDFDGPNGDGLTISPPVDAMRETIPGMDGWTQHVTVEKVPEGALNGPANQSLSPDQSVMRMTCRVSYQGPDDQKPMNLTRLVWVRSGGP